MEKITIILYNEKILERQDSKMIINVLEVVSNNYPFNDGVKFK